MSLFQEYAPHSPSYIMITMIIPIMIFTSLYLISWLNWTASKLARLPFFGMLFHVAETIFSSR